MTIEGNYMKDTRTIQESVSRCSTTSQWDRLLVIYDLIPPDMRKLHGYISAVCLQTTGNRTKAITHAPESN